MKTRKTWVLSHPEKHPVKIGIKASATKAEAKECWLEKNKRRTLPRGTRVALVDLEIVPKEKKIPQKETIAALADTGLTQREIADQTGIAFGNVRWWFCKLKLNKK